MLRAIAYYWQIAKLDRSERITSKAFDCRVSEIKAGPDAAQKRYELRDQEHFELKTIDDIRWDLKSKKMLLNARRYDVSLPEWGDKQGWAENSTLGTNNLTTKAYADLRTAVRKESNERWQFWELRTKVIGLLLTGATGAMGTLIGLIVVTAK